MQPGEHRAQLASACLEKLLAKAILDSLGRFRVHIGRRFLVKRERVAEELAIPLLRPSLPASRRLSCRWCSSDREFDCCFLQIQDRP